MPELMKICGWESSERLGGFLLEVCAFAAIKHHFPAPSRSIYVYHGHRPFKRAVIDLCPQIDRAHGVGAFQIPMQLLSWKGAKAFIAKKRPTDSALLAAYKDVSDSQLIVSPNLRHHAYSNLLPHPKFRVPEARTAELEDQLLQAGVAPDRFMVTVHCREGGMHDDAQNIRNVDPHVYYELMRHIIEAQGGQVVRLGDPSMTPLPPTPGLVDLSRSGDDLMLEAFAISRSRYAVCSNSGVLHLAAALQAPLLATDIITSIGFPLHPEHLVLTKTFVDTDGRAVRQEEAYQLGLLERELPGGPPGYRVLSCTAAELIAAADRMFDMTTDAPAWRTPSPDRDAPSSDSGDFFRRLMADPKSRRDDVNFA